MKAVHQKLTLYEDNEAYTFVPTDGGRPSLSIYKNSSNISLNAPNASISTESRRSTKPIYGILGIISLSMSDYVIVMTGREVRGRLMGHDIYRATDWMFLPLNPNVSVEHPPHPVEGHLLALVRSHLNGGTYLFSYTWDLTRRLQVQWKENDEVLGKALWETADDRFFWNKYIQGPLIQASDGQDLSAFILPIMYGTFDIRPAFVHGRHIQLCLISRRSRYRAGTRYFRRGIDKEGNVANFVETEQILLVEAPQTAAQRSFDNFVTQMSFVQIRGSIPLFWAEINTLRYKPDLQIMDLKDTADTMRTHLQRQVDTYGHISMVNLINHKGHEQPLKDALERYVNWLSMPDVRYEYFDFHNECKHMRWDRLSILIEKLEEDLVKEGYFHLNSTESRPARVQLGAVRTNCMDNLDRTNVAQASIAKWVLNQQLHAIGILSATESIDDYEALAKDFRELWADHADEIATAYGGSGALKSDFTRSNQRTQKGVVEDGIKSVMRYIKNNYFDGPRQDAFDLFSGNFVPRQNPSAGMFLINDGRPLLTRSMPAVAFFSFFMICAGLTLPRSSDYSLVYYFALWLIVLALAALFILINGIDYVSWPRLIPPTDVIYYSGPGFRSARNGMGWGRAEEDEAQLKTHTRTKSKMDEIELGTKKRVD